MQLLITLEYRLLISIIILFSELPIMANVYFCIYPDCPFPIFYSLQICAILSIMNKEVCVKSTYFFKTFPRNQPSCRIDIISKILFFYSSQISIRYKITRHVSSKLPIQTIILTIHMYW